jgi:hypothetical protein
VAQRKVAAGSCFLHPESSCTRALVPSEWLWVNEGRTELPPASLQRSGPGECSWHESCDHQRA